MTALPSFGGEYNAATAVTADGSVIVGFSTSGSDGFVYAFRYTVATNEIENLGTLGGTYSFAYGVSDDGLTVAGNSTLEDNASARAFRFDTGSGMTNIGTLGGDSFAQGMSAVSKQS